MKKLIQAFVIIFPILLCVSGYCQQKDTVKVWAVSGKTVEIKNKKHRDPLPLSHIAVVNSIDKSNYRATSLDDGSFRMVVPEGKYNLAIENIGHKTFKMKVDIIGQDVDLGEIALQIGEELEAASIKVRSLVHRHGTRISYDVVHDPDRSKINMTEMISRIPGLNMSNRNGNLEYNHSGFKKILIDGSEIGLINVGRQYPMEFIKAHYMKKIEVVLPGDPEYNNTEPLLLIHLAQKLPFGVAAQLSQSTTTLNSYSQGVDAVVNAPIVGIGVGYSHEFERAPTAVNESVTDMKDSEAEPAKKESRQSSWSRAYNHNLNTNLFKSFADDAIKVKAAFNTSYSESKSLSEAYTRLYSSDNTVIDNNANISRDKSTSPFRFNGAMDLDVNLRKVLNKKNPLYRSRIKVQCSLNDRKTDSYTENSSFDQTNIAEQKENKFKASISNISILTSPIVLNSSFYGGYYKREYYNDESFSNSFSESSGFDYTQNVSYGRLSVFGKAFKGLIGFSGELYADNVDNEGDYIYGTERTPLDYSSFTLNPKARVSYNYKKGYFSLSYNRYLKRPDIKMLTPYEDFSNPYHIKTGNPELKGQTTDSYSLYFLRNNSIKWLNSTVLSASYSKTSDLFSPVTTIREDGVSVKSYCNLGKSETISFSADLNGNVCKNLTYNVHVNCSKSTFCLPSGINNNTFSTSFFSGLDWITKYTSIMTTFRLSPRGLSAQSSKVYLDPGLEMIISRYFKKPKIGVSIEAYDLLRSGGQRKSVVEDVNFIERRNNYSYGRYVGFSVFWQIGAFKNAEIVTVDAIDM